MHRPRLSRHSLVQHRAATGRRAACAVGLGLALLAGTARAHDTWLLPERFVLPAPRTLTLEMTSGMRFPRLESAIERDRVARALVRDARGTADLERRRNETRALAFLVRLESPGTATLAVELKPRALDLTPAQVREYVAEIGAPDDVRRAWEASGARRWRETYTKHAKTFVRVGDVADRGWAGPVGLAFELVPESDPTALAPGAAFAVRLLREGRPAAGLAVGLVHGGDGRTTLVRTDAEGRASFELTARGRYLVRATELRPSANGPAGESWESDFTTLTFEVR